MLERYGFYLLALGFAMGCVGWFWLVVEAFKVRVLWGLLVLFFPPSAILFVPLHVRRVLRPLFVLVLACLVSAAPYGLSYYERNFGTLKPYEQRVDGELRITLTGLRDFDYSTLVSRPDVAVLQMANADVTDEALHYLSRMGALRKLDISNSQVTDEGLKSLAELPQLQEIYLARTKITDEGFRKYLAPRESLLHVDLTGTAVKGKTKRDWKKSGPAGREYVD
jgi:hypothetical protein